ncbi:MAG TPA: hypothetical protein VG103_04950 [Chthoniobacterales bacterium]|nr:hypothetical protein [Chthoniobacterales bacterium]
MTLGSEKKCQAYLLAFCLFAGLLDSMPGISLVVCVSKEQDLLKRLLRDTADCYDDLVVVHDGPEAIDQDTRVDQLVAEYGGRFFVRPRSFQQESHWPFAWKQARNAWILRLDADEVPSTELKNWLQAFCARPEPDKSTAGYTCIWPLWDGQRTVTKYWPNGRIFLFHKDRVRFFGMAEQVPIPDGKFEALQLILEHRPTRKSFGFSNLLLRKQAYHWRRVIAQSLLGKPTDLQCWRWTSEQWPEIWEEIRQRPFRTAFYRLMMWPLFNMRQMKRVEGRVILSAIAFTGIHHCLVALMYWYLRLSRSNT